MKKLISIFVAFTMFMTIFSNFDVRAAANSNEKIVNGAKKNIEEEIVKDLQEELVEEYDDEILDDINLDAVHNGNEIQIEMKTEVLDLDFFIDPITEEIEVFSRIKDDNGQEKTRNYDIILHQTNDQNFLATFIDKKTGESFTFDSTEIQASIAPAVVYAIITFVARWGAKKAINKYGKKALKEAAKFVTKSNSPVWKNCKRQIFHTF